MSAKSKLQGRWLPGLLGAFLAVMVGMVLHDRTWGSRLVNLSYDLLTVAKPISVPTNAMLVLMDEASHARLSQPLNAPWDRAIHAQLVERLTEAGAKAIAFDIVFSDPYPGRPEADEKFSRSLTSSRRVILAADYVRVSEARQEFIVPIEPLRDAAAAIGSAEVIPGRDLIVRQHTPPEALDSLGEATAKFLHPQTTWPANRWINYYGPPNTLPYVSYEAALNGDAALFRDKVVFVGARVMTRFAGDRKDEYPSPYSSWLSSREAHYISGVEIQATAFANLINNEWLKRLPAAFEFAVLSLFGVASGALLMRLRPWTATLLALLMAVAVALCSYVAFRTSLHWFPWLICVAQIVLVWIVSVAVNSFRLYLERRLYEQTLGLYLSPKLVGKFAQDERFRRPGAEKQMLTILFSDIADFTSIAEGMDSDELAKLMNSYFQRAVTECIHFTDGTVVKYIGDAIFAFWNAPDLQTDHAVRACEAALRFRDQGVSNVNGRQLITRIGLHTGLANVGNFGSVERVDYTALGESINLASRMEGLNKFLGTTVLLTGATQAQVDSHFSTRPLGRFRLKGFEKAVEVFELLGRKGSPTEPWQAHFATALAAFAARDWESAVHGFRKVIEMRVQDGPSSFYLDRIEELRVLPGTGWTGEIDLKEK